MSRHRRAGAFAAAMSLVLIAQGGLLLNRVNATATAALKTQPSLNATLAAVSGELMSARSTKNATKTLSRSYWFLNRTVAYNPTNKTQMSALAQFTYGRLRFESLLKQGFAFTTTSTVPGFGQGVVAAASNITCFVDSKTGIVSNLQQNTKLSCTAGGQRIVIPTAGKYVTKLEMAIDKELPLIGRFVFHVRDRLDSKPKVYTCGFAGGDAISLFPPGYIATSIDVGCIPLTPQAIGKRRRSLSASVATNAANPELVNAVVLSETIAREQSPDKPVSALVVATGVVKGSTFAVSPSTLSPEAVNQLETASNDTSACPAATPDICAAAGGGGNLCVSFAHDNNNCGSCSNACPSTQSCVAGACACPSATPNFCAAIGCVDFTQDRSNCGSCGNVCPAAQSCVSGACSCPSATPNFCAANGCVDFTQDRSNCGSCGNVCPAAQSCVSGACSCPSATPNFCAANGCVDFTQDRSNCGSCGNVCPAAQSCVSGACSCPSATPNFCAANGCVDFTQDRSNCGSCGNVCPAAQSCVSGACSCPSATPNFCAANGCVDFKQDRSNCGSCGNVCPATQSCVSGTCSCQATDESTLRACLAAAVPGGAIQVIGTITLNSPATNTPALVVDKSVKFLGGQNSVLQSTTVESAAPLTFIQVTADNVEFGSGLTIKQRAPTSDPGGIATAVGVPGGTVVNGLVSAAAVEFVEFGYLMRGSFSISGSTTYIGRLGNNHRHVAVYKMTADSTVHDLTFDFPSEATPVSNVVFLTTTADSSFTGKLTVQNVVQRNLAIACRQFFNFEAGYSAISSMALEIRSNQWNDANGGIFLFFGVDNPLARFTSVNIANNYQGDAGTASYKGIFFVTGASSSPHKTIGNYSNLATSGNDSPAQRTGPGVLRPSYFWLPAFPGQQIDTFAADSTVYA